MSRIVQQRTTNVVSASSANTTTGQSTKQDIGTDDEISILLDVTAVSGTSPSMTVSVEWTHDGSTWFAADTADTFTAITAAKKTVKNFTVKGLGFRLVWTITGTTPSFTFSAHSVVGA